ncbi:Coenzyme F420 hydrogenase/dehydrogenase, beta subunit C-terminal domain [Butyrivibrio sp. FCS014]|uniref:Coenzyme F420 hydrogenase/dehydrogenase, beta subunit C-terminal domain n=1 Tax=Butyrivibrio sp. FCS014 TaxID=1408304 RepID=UPI00046701FE|nr:Coenzyme F420 hydrogenase/dehydrogenase, beta subunit C-terminal domain [Butyrivibrio sp. FCS014]
MDNTVRSQLFRKIIDNDLCSKCGTCIGVCPVNAICYDSNKDIPIISPNAECINCNRCYASCPGQGFEYRKEKKDREVLVGSPLLFAETYAKDETIRKNGTSGGSVTALLAYLLDLRIIDKAVVLSLGESDRPNINILSSSNEISQSHQQSKYYSAPLNLAIKDILSSEEKWAVVGLPCHIQGINKAIKTIPSLKDRIVIKLGLFCGYTVSKEAPLALRRYLGSDLNSRLLGWRKGEYPGYVTFEHNHDIRKMLIYDAYCIMNVFYANERCFYCIDGTNQFADLSFGDIHTFGNKSNVTIVYSEKGKELLQDAEKYIHVEVFDKTDKRYSCVDGIIQAKRIKGLYNIRLKRGGVPINDICFSDIKESLSPKGRMFLWIQRTLTNVVRKKYILEILEKKPKLQMIIGRYIYTYPSRVLALRGLRYIRSKLRK